jgi:hypothetical protein
MAVGEERAEERAEVNEYATEKKLVSCMRLNPPEGLWNNNKKGSKPNV